jgi:hypothetical protein
MPIEEMFTELPTVATADMSDIICAVQGYSSPSSLGLSVQETLQQVYNLFQSNVILYNAGNPNGAVAGTTYQLCWDTVDNILWVCTTSGTATTAVWKHSIQLTAGSGITITQSGDIIQIAASGGSVNTGTANQIAYYATTGTVISGLTGANSAMLVTNATGVPAMTASMTNGQIIVGSTGGTPIPATISAGTNISVTNGANSITIAATGTAGIGWNHVTATTQTMTADAGYVADNVALVTLTMPLTAAFGTVIIVQGLGSGGWTIAQRVGQTINVGNIPSTAGVGGSISSTNRYDSITLLCVVANTTWTTLSTVGELSVV